ncbi:MAG TPA: hypothetical protein VHA12_03905 [Candidatus Nanoarchaeia archaeon]|nr:hypothetical protein [Candidatus Nanoarchaeia archaeon]
MSDGHSDVEQDKTLSERLSNLLSLEDKLVVDTNFFADLRLDDAQKLLRQWIEYSNMRRGYDLAPRKEFAYLHILALGDFLGQRIDSGKLWAVVSGNLPNYMKTKEDEERVKGYIERYSEEN